MEKGSDATKRGGGEERDESTHRKKWQAEERGTERVSCSHVIGIIGPIWPQQVLQTPEQ